MFPSSVVVATTKVHIFKQITTFRDTEFPHFQLLLLPQRYIFSSKSQQLPTLIYLVTRCCCYHKGTYFQANHNIAYNGRRLLTVVVATTKVHIFKQITTNCWYTYNTDLLLLLPQRYIFSSKSQRIINHIKKGQVVVATTKVHIFKQITTVIDQPRLYLGLLLLPQRYIFSSKSQPTITDEYYKRSCCCYHKGTYFQANHNSFSIALTAGRVVVATTKVHIFKQITTILVSNTAFFSCCCYHKGTYFQANHNIFPCVRKLILLLLLPQRYIFSSKSQHQVTLILVT